MQRRPSAYKVRAQSAGEGVLTTSQGAVISAEERRKMLRRKSSVPENLYVYEITIPDIEEGFDDIIYYKIVIKAIGNIEWSLFRRYSDFFDVHTDISLELTTVTFESNFPQKVYSSWLGPLRQQQIEKRRLRLQDWLQEFLSITNGSVRPKDAKQEEVTKMQEKLDAFLEVKEKIRAHTIAQAAKITPAVDESAIAIFGAVIPPIVVPKVAPSLSNVFASFGDGNQSESDENDDSNIDNDTDHKEGCDDTDQLNTDTNNNQDNSKEENKAYHNVDKDGMEYEEDAEER